MYVEERWEGCVREVGVGAASLLGVIVVNEEGHWIGLGWLRPSRKNPGGC